MMSFSKITYSYIDAANWSTVENIFLDGVLSDADREILNSKLGSCGFFIPFDLQLGIRELQYSVSDEMTEEDHCFHVMDVSVGGVAILNTLPEGAKAIPVADFVAAFARITEWDAAAAVDRLDLIA